MIHEGFVNLLRSSLDETVKLCVLLYNIFHYTPLIVFLAVLYVI